MSKHLSAFSKMRKTQTQDRKPSSTTTTTTVKVAAPTRPSVPSKPTTTPKAASSSAKSSKAPASKASSSPSMRSERRPSYSDHQWEERHWVKPFASGVTQVVATLHFPPEKDDPHDLRRIPEEEDLYGRAQEHAHGSSRASHDSKSGKSKASSSAAPKKGSASPATKSKSSPALSKKSSVSPSTKSSAPSLKNAVSPSSKSSATLSSKGSASSLWSERPSSASSNATCATSWSVASSATTVMTDLDEVASECECNSNRPDSCALGDFDPFRLRKASDSKLKRPDSTVSSCSGSSCPGTIYSRPRTGKSSRSNVNVNISFEVVAEEDDAIYLQRTPNPRPSRRWR